MSKSFLLAVVGIVLAIVLGVWVDTRIAAGVGALALLGAIIFGYVANKKAGEANYREAERGARQVRDEIVEAESEQRRS